MLVTPFRDHYERCRELGPEQQLQECIDYLQNPDVLITEFLESYYLVERDWDPEAQLSGNPSDEGELVLEPFYETLELCVREASGEDHRLVCVSGAFSPLPEEKHPALARRGLDYIGLREGNLPVVILGVAQTPNEATPYLLLLRALNCFAELAPPFQIAKLGQQVLGHGVDPDARFNLQVAISTCDSELSTLETFARDLADVFKTRLAEHPQFKETLGSIECLGINSDAEEGPQLLDLRWRV